eukprot:338219-Hanusia_phi.AAC.1
MAVMRPGAMIARARIGPRRITVKLNRHGPAAGPSSQTARGGLSRARGGLYSVQRRVPNTLCRHSL